MELAFNNFIMGSVNNLFMKFDKTSSGQIDYAEAKDSIDDSFSMIYAGGITYTPDQFDNFFMTKDKSGAGTVNKLAMMEFFKNPEEWKNLPVVPKQVAVEEVRAEPSVADIVEPTTP